MTPKRSEQDDSAYEALVARSPGRKPRVLVAASVADGDAWVCKAGTVVEDRELAKRLKSQSEPPQIVAVAKINPTLLRALRQQPPSVLIVVGPPQDDQLEELAGLPTRVLGPNAVLRIGKGDLLACAGSRTELDALVRVVGAEAVGLALAPTPSWLPQWLAARNDAPAVGYVPASALGPEWARWSRSTDAIHVLVPTGVTTPQVEQPNHGSLTAAVGAHALERFTGPVFPAPRVLAAILRGAAGQPAESLRSPETSALWDQARRALPGVGAMVGMEAPDDSVPSDVPTAAFLAQRALIRLRRRMELAEQSPGEPTIDDDAANRAEQVLAGAGETLSDQESKVVLRGFGIDVTRQAVAASASGAAHYAETIGFPAVLKAVSPDLRRKRDMGAVVLGLPTAAAVRRAYASIVSKVEQQAPTARLDGVVVAEMIETGLDVHCGIVRTDTGDLAIYARPVIGVGASAEPTLVLSPLEVTDAMILAQTVLSQLPVPAMRRATDPDIGPLATLLLRLDALARRFPQRLLGVDVNPARLCDDRGWVVLDARIVQAPHLEGL